LYTDSSSKGFNLAHNTDQGIFEYLTSYPEDGKRFAAGMQTFSADISGNSPSFLLGGYPWEALGNATLVDVGGSEGQISCAIAEAFPKLKCIVQDLPEVIQAANIPKALSERVHLQAHDFFEEQQTIGDVYLFRWILHDWPDKYVIQILKQLVPAMRPGSRVIVNDSVAPGFNTVPYDVERTVR
jgi:hypothetical protein